MRSVPFNVLTTVSMGLLFGFIFWILDNMRAVPLFMTIAFVLGGFAEACRRWVISLDDET